MPMPPVIHINLVEHDTRREQAVAEMLVITLLTAIVVIAMLIFYFNQVERVSLGKRQYHQLQQELLRYGPSQAAINLSRDMKKQLDEKSRQVDTLKLQGMPLTIILDDIEQAMPEGGRLINLAAADNKITLKGYTSNFSSAARLVVSLQQSPRFQDVAVLNLQREEESGKVMFSLEMVWKKGDKI